MNVVPPPPPLDPNEQTPLPVGWQMFQDSTTGRYYYHNAAQNVTQWHRPMVVNAVPRAPAAAAEAHRIQRTMNGGATTSTTTSTTPHRPSSFKGRVSAAFHAAREASGGAGATKLMAVRAKVAAAYNASQTSPASPGVAGGGGKGCCSHCHVPAKNKRLCLGCGKKYCETCGYACLFPDTCVKCGDANNANNVKVSHKDVSTLVCSTCHTKKKNLRQCVVCGTWHCLTCDAADLGDKAEGIKCVKKGCLGKVPHQALVAKQVIEHVRNTNLLRAVVMVNGKSLGDVDKWIALCAGARIEPGGWWYDPKSGWMGRIGEGPKFVIAPALAIGGKALDPNCSDGDTGIFLNGRQIKGNEKTKYDAASLRLTPGSWFYEHNGDYGPNFGPDAGRVKGNFWRKGGRNLAIALGVAVVGFSMFGGGGEGGVGGGEGGSGGWVDNYGYGDKIGELSDGTMFVSTTTGYGEGIDFYC